MLKTINDWLPWVTVAIMYIAGKVASYYEFAKKNDPTAAEKIKHIGTLAEWAVADQSRFTDKSGSVKFNDAVKQLTDHGIDKTTAQGAVQDAYLNADLPKPEPVEIPKVTEPVVSQKQDELVVPTNAEPVNDDNAVIDDLEVH